MTDNGEWAFPDALQPQPAQLAFELEPALSSVVALRAEVPSDAFTAPFLGEERSGNGVVISEDGLVLTIGYLITEAETLWLVTAAGMACPAHVVGYDQTTGFGLVQALGRLGTPALALGSSQSARVGDEVIVSGNGGRRHALTARVLAKREFAGYWEYLLDEAIFTSPPHPNWGGAALIGADGRLLGIGSLFIQEIRGETASREGNMFVPIDLLKPILDDLRRLGRVDAPARPWLGMFTTEAEGNPVVTGLAGDAPAQQAGLEVGDLVLAVGERPVVDMADMLRRIWALGPAGTVVPLTVARGSDQHRISVHSADRSDFLKSPGLH